MSEIPDHAGCGLFAGRTPQPVEFWLYDALHQEGKQLIRSWAARSYETDDPFESFIYCWIAVNGWGACIAETDRDWVDAVAADENLGIDIAICPLCGGALRIIACIEDPIVIEKILTHLDKKDPDPSVEPAQLPPCRAPPQSDLFD